MISNIGAWTPPPSCLPTSQQMSQRKTKREEASVTIWAWLGVRWKIIPYILLSSISSVCTVISEGLTGEVGDTCTVCGVIVTRYYGYGERSFRVTCGQYMYLMCRGSLMIVECELAFPSSVQLIYLVRVSLFCFHQTPPLRLFLQQPRPPTPHSKTSKQIEDNRDAKGLRDSLSPWQQYPSNHHSSKHSSNLITPPTSLSLSLSSISLSEGFTCLHSRQIASIDISG